MRVSNTFGELFRLTTFGESHGPAMGAVIEGCPAGVIWRQDVMDDFLARRRPGGELTSARREPDQVEILSGVFEGKTLGTPIGAVIRNRDARPGDYSNPEIKTRRGHATDLWQEKYGHSDPRGSGRASGRETVSRVIGGSVARMLVEQLCREARIESITERIGPVEGDETKMAELLRAACESGESYGGIVRIRISGIPRGLGTPVFGKLKSRLASAYLGIGATNGIDIGDGFASAALSGGEFHSQEQEYGGIRGGISTGDPVSVRIAFKPTSSRLGVAKSGRHDPCIIPRAIPVLEAMTWLVLADLILLSRLDRI